MTATEETIQDPDLARVGVALRRAAQKARKTARDTHTPLVVHRDGVSWNVSMRKRNRSHAKTDV